MAPDAIAPDGSEITYLVQDARTASLVGVRLPAGGRSRPISHRTVEEIWYVTDGRGRVWRRPPGGAATIHEVEPGSVLTIPAGWAFQFEAEAGSDLRFLCFTSPPWPGETESSPVEDAALGPASPAGVSEAGEAR